MNVKFKRGDTRTAIRATLLANGAPVDLTGASVRFLMADTRGSLVIGRPVDEVQPAAGKVLVVFEPGDTDRAGLFLAEFEVQWSDGRRETYPTGGYLQIEIIPDLG